MRTPVRLDYRSKPSFLGFMARMWRPKGRFDAAQGLPEMLATWHGQRSAPSERADVLALSGLPPGNGLSILHPHTASFPMLMALLSHPVFPLPIWRVLQVRNRMTLHEAIAPDATLDLAVGTGAARILEKGIEMDLRVTASAQGRLAFEAVNTFYSRGRFGATQAAAPESPLPDGTPVAEWRMPTHGRWAYSRLSGDFNPLHINDAYARRQGFAHAFAHPQRAIGQCLARLGAAHHAPMRLDTWIKGPVFYGAQLSLCAGVRADGGNFALHVDGDTRPAIVGRYHTTIQCKDDAT